MQKTTTARVKMNRSAAKKMKMESAASNGYSMIHSGHYMTSCLHDQNEDTVEMPIASPDATNNEVTVNTINADNYVDQDNETINKTSNASSSGVANGTLTSTGVGGSDVVGVSSMGNLSATKAITDVSSMGSGAQLVVAKNSNVASLAMNKQYMNGVPSISNQLNALNTLNSSHSKSLLKNYLLATSGNNAAAAAAAAAILNLIFTNQGASISGGLTLDKANKSLMKLIFYIKTAYSNNLTSPKWKNFKGLKLQVTEKIRINNVIWRSWFEQYGIKDSAKRKKRLVCQFSNGLDETKPVLTKMSIKEGKYWKARLESITNEYKKWRELSRKQIKGINDGAQLANNLFAPSPPTITCASSSSSKAIKISGQDKYTSSNYLSNNSYENISSSGNLKSSSFGSEKGTYMSHLNYPPAENLTSLGGGSGTTSNQTTMYNYNNYNSIVNTDATNYTVNAPLNQDFGPNQINANVNTNNYNTAFYPPNQTSYGPIVNEFNEYGNQINSENYPNYTNVSFNSNLSNNNSLAVNNNNLNNVSNLTMSKSNMNNMAVSTFSTPNIPVAQQSSSLSASVSQNASTYQHSPIASKQIPYNNRCRSPSPNLFMDFDLYNFSSDTLFSTYLAEDTKDPIIGTNPDLFQPDLMHLYPNFDFFELCDNEFSKSLADPIKSNSNSPVNGNNQQQQQTILNEAGFSQINVNEGQNLNNPMVNLNHSMSIPNAISYDDPMRRASLHTSISMPEAPITSPVSQKQTQPSNGKLITVDYSDLANFNTLATVAAAQSANISPNHIVQSKPNLIEQPPVKSNNNMYAINDIGQVKMTQYTSNSNQRDNNMQFVGRSTTPSSSMNNNVNSSNTIRNLLALNNPNVKSTQVLNNSSSNLRISTGVLAASGASIAPLQPHPPLMSSTSKNPQSTSIYSGSASLLPGPNAKSPSTNGVNLQLPLSSTSNIDQQQQQQSISLVTDKNGKLKNENQTISSLLAVLNGNNAQVMSSNPNEYLTSPKESSETQAIASKSGQKRGRKNVEAVKNLNQPMALMPATSQSSGRHSSKQLLSKSVSKKDKQSNMNEQFEQQQYENQSVVKYQQQPPIYDYQSLMVGQPQPAPLPPQSAQQPQLIHESDSSVNSPINSPNNSSNSSHFNNYPNGPSSANYSLPMNLQYNQASESHANDFIINKALNNSRQSPSNKPVKEMSLNIYTNSLSMNPVVSSSNTSLSPGASRLNRSNSLLSMNAINDANVSNAEQKRRCNIQHGFDRLQELVPALFDGKNGKVSKALMLSKTSDYIKELQLAREKRVSDLDVYKQELQLLSDKIAECQSQLPANGVSVSGNLNKTERYEQKFNAYIKEKTLENWKFFIFSLILKPLFESFISNVNTSCKEDMERTFQEWQQKYCNLTQLRPIASNALRQLSKTTSILTNSSKLPEECLSTVITKIS